MSWIPAGFGWNVETLVFVELNLVDLSIFLMVWVMFRMFRPILDRKDRIVGWVDRMTAPTEADRILEEKRRGR